MRASRVWTCLVVADLQACLLLLRFLCLHSLGSLWSDHPFRRRVLLTPPLNHSHFPSPSLPSDPTLPFFLFHAYIRLLMVEYVYARHDFIPEHEDEIPFRAGERIEVVEKDELYEDGWWKVCSCSFRSPLINWPRSPSPRIRGSISAQRILISFSRHIACPNLTVPPLRFCHTLLFHTLRGGPFVLE